MMTAIAIGASAQIPQPCDKACEGLDITEHTYAIKDGDTLKLDVYVDPAATRFGNKRPVYIYSFGGGWESGTRKDAATDMIPFLTNLAREGFVGVGIDYRLGYLKARQAGKVQDISITLIALQKQWDTKPVAEATQQAIAIGVEDLYDATSYLVNNAEKLGIDPDKIIIGGGSAGAINSITAEYWLCNGTDLAKKHLPEGFQYAGLINCAGDIWIDGKNDPVWKTKPCPMMLFHGERDNIVPIDRLYLSSVNGGFVGPQIIAPQLKAMEVPYWLYVATDADHVIAGTPNIYNQKEMLSFIDRVILGDEKVAIETKDTAYGEPRTTIGWIQKMMNGVSKEDILKQIK